MEPAAYRHFEINRLAPSRTLLPADTTIRLDQAKLKPPPTRVEHILRSVCTVAMAVVLIAHISLRVI